MWSDLPLGSLNASTEACVSLSAIVPPLLCGEAFYGKQRRGSPGGYMADCGPMT